MDYIQKQIIGYFLITIVGALIGYISGKIGVWIEDPSLIVLIGILLGAFEFAAIKWIKYSYQLPEKPRVEVKTWDDGWNHVNITTNTDSTEFYPKGVDPNENTT